jgi:hypothetical protein
VTTQIFCSAGEGIVCGDLEPPVDPNDCNITAVFRYSVTNNGNESFTVTNAVVFVNENAAVSILDRFPQPPVVEPGRTIFGTAQEVINICGTEDFTVTLLVNASTAIGGVCSDTDEFQFIPPPVS